MEKTMTESEWRKIANQLEQLVLGEDCFNQLLKHSLSDLNREADVLVEDSRHDQSYIDFLNQQVVLNARGESWSKRLQQRVDALEYWTDKDIHRIQIRCGDREMIIHCDKVFEEVIHVETY